jgi:hypothetical protein
MNFLRGQLTGLIEQRNALFTQVKDLERNLEEARYTTLHIGNILAEERIELHYTKQELGALRIEKAERLDLLQQQMTQNFEILLSLKSTIALANTR